VSLLESVKVTPPGGATSVKDTDSGAAAPGATIKPEPKVMSAAIPDEDKTKKSKQAVRG
jgi:hypothetical protein